MTPLSTLRAIYRLGRDYRALPSTAHGRRLETRKGAYDRLVASGCDFSITEMVYVVERAFDGRTR